jgi:hypothetical protein
LHRRPFKKCRIYRKEKKAMVREILEEDRDILGSGRVAK